MGRSVSTPRNAVHVFYAAVDIFESWEWDDIVEGLQASLLKAYPTVRSADYWIDREDRVIAENGFAAFGVSEYNGIVAIWAMPGKYFGDRPRLADRWIRSIDRKLQRVVNDSFGTVLRRVGHFSNGESVYEQAS